MPSPRALRHRLARASLVLFPLCVACAPDEPPAASKQPPPPRLETVLARPAEDLPVVVRSDGSVIADLSSSHHHATLVRIEAGGVRRIACVADAPSADAFLRGDHVDAPEAP